MKLKEFGNLFNILNLPIAYNHFEKQTAPPFLIYFTIEHSTTYADSIIVMTLTQCVLEFYSPKKDVQQEVKIEQILEQSGIAFEKSELYVDTERLYQITYEIELIE